MKFAQYIINTGFLTGLLIAGVLLVNSCKSKDRVLALEKPDSRKGRKIQAKKYINQLHDGVLLVRLFTKETVITALEEAGKNEKAEEIEELQRKENKMIIKAFRESYDFSPVYFFYSDQSTDLKNGDLANVTFLNDSLAEDTSIRLKNNNYLIAEFGRIAQDTASAVDNYSTGSTEDGVELKKTYYGGTNMGFPALVIKSRELVQLRKPFPYYVKSYESSVLPRDKSLTVTKLNDRLHNFYEKQGG